MSRLAERRARTCGLLIALMLCSSVCASAQDQDRSSPLGDVFKRVVFDPTTYGPAIVMYDSAHVDWKTSQPFFRNGFYERNPRYTVSGLPNDVPLSYGAGNRQIVSDALADLQISFVNNLTGNVIERVLVDRYPNHRRLWRTLGWVERISFASYTSYLWSAEHFRQARLNEQLARQYGYK